LGLGAIHLNTMYRCTNTASGLLRLLAGVLLAAV